MRHRRAWYALLAGGIVLAALSVPITLIALSGRLPLYAYTLSSALSSLGATPIHDYGADGGPITAVLISPDDVTLRIVTIQKVGTS